MPMLKRKNVPEGIIKEFEDDGWTIDWEHYGKAIKDVPDNDHVHTRRLKFCEFISSEIGDFEVLNPDTFEGVTIEGAELQVYMARAKWDDENKNAKLVQILPAVVTIPKDKVEKMKKQGVGTKSTNNE